MTAGERKAMIASVNNPNSVMATDIYKSEALELIVRFPDFPADRILVRCRFPNDASDPRSLGELFKTLGR